MQTEMDATELKQVFKQALIETLEEKTDLFHDIIMEALEDIALSRAISEGEDIENVSNINISPDLIPAPFLRPIENAPPG